MTPDAVAGGPRTTQRGSAAPIAPLSKRQARVCPDCDGQGQVWTYDFYDGFERNRRWEACETCNGDGYEPVTEDDND
jgi:DnaJ-class molecular chaperone